MYDYVVVGAGSAGCVLAARLGEDRDVRVGVVEAGPPDTEPVLNYRLIADEGAVAASTVTYLVPVVAVVLGALILDEPLTWHLLVGGVIILVGVAVSEGRLSKTVREESLRHQTELERRNL
jgi:choline dehydrogenase-like flavoprotein